jgi:hypothetical protein
MPLSGLWAAMDKIEGVLADYACACGHEARL